jgi:protein O-GlcNAc transferase
MQTNMHATTFTIPGGASVVVPDNPRLMTPFVLEEQGDWFENEIHFIRRWLKPGMAVVDVGANYGLYTLTCAQLVGPAGRVWSYEPASLPRSFLSESIVKNGLAQVQVVGRALSDHEGTARLGIASNAELNSLNETGQSGETVQLATLDSESTAWDREIDFVKLDAEGEEIRILSQAKGFLAKHDPLVMFEYKHGASINEGLLQAISELGMGIYRHLPGLNVLVPLVTSEPADPFLLNVFGCSAKRAQALAAQGLLVTEVPELPAIDVEGAEAFVADWLQQRPWRTCLWPSGSPESGRPGMPVYLAAIAELIRSENSQLSIAERLARARRGMANLLVSMKYECNVSRLLSTARAAMDLGERGASVAMLGEVVKMVSLRSNNVGSLLPEPFLPPDSRHDDLTPENHAPGEVLAIMVDEPYVERSAFSTYFTGERAMPMLRRLAANPLHSVASERRIGAAKKILPL